MTELDTLPPLNATVDVEPAAIEEFQSRGHALVRGLCTPEEVAAFRPAIVEAARRRNPEPPPMELRDTYGKAFIQSINLWRLDETVKAFVFAPRFAKVAADLLGVPAVRLYHDQALFKEADGGATPWHQDQIYWPLDTDHTITMWMPLVDVPPEVGSMTFASGSNLCGDLGAFDISDASEETVTRIVEERALELTTYGAAAAGDATFHAGWTLHRAGPNPTGVMREVMTIIWYADGARATEPQNLYQEFDLRMWLKGTEPGALANGDRNPRLWPQS
jgi:ectoine hydroxylase-related dioxygenase (phytanoyl-CoA dioxygenase family)